LNIHDRITARRGVISSGAIDVSLRLRLRELAERFALDLIESLRGATVEEVGQAMDALKSFRSAARIFRGPLLGNDRRGGREERGSRHEMGAAASDRPSLAPGVVRTPFDITMPSELLDAVESDSARARKEESTPSSSRRVRASLPSLLVDRAKPVRAPSSATPVVAEVVPPPTVSLREGERVLRATGSGVVIRRARPV